jgi:hypothetical protein
MNRATARSSEDCPMISSICRQGRRLGVAVLCLLALPALLAGQKVDQARGVDTRVDYASLTRFGPWDDRNYRLTKEDLAWLAPNEAELMDPIPAFFRVELRKANRGMLKSGEAQYPRSALQVFEIRYGGYLIDGKTYKGLEVRDGKFRVIAEDPAAEDGEEFSLRSLNGESRMTTPNGAAETSLEMHPLNSEIVIAGSNGPGGGQVMHFSTNGGATWTPAAALPLGGTCCDPTVDWSADGTRAYAATLGGCGASCNVWFYRSNDNGQTWNHLEADTPGDPRREITAANTSDKEFLHVDKFTTSPQRDNIYLTWHDNNTLRFARSTNFGNTWSAPIAISTGVNESGIGSDITTDRNGNVYYFWPATNSRRILMRRSTNGGATFAATVQVSTTNAGFDFPIPAIETRRAWVYVAADSDLTAGNFSNSVYLAWTDTTAAESTVAANNHARIRVAYSRNGGTSWTVVTPHPTADANTVDRFNPWLGVDRFGRVHLIYYDTRHSAGRTGADIYHQVSVNGGVSWSAGQRLTAQTSRNITNAFEFGDYNGLDIVGNQLLGSFTDNRDESGGTGQSVDVYAAGQVLADLPPPTVVLTCSGNYRGSTQVSCSAGVSGGCGGNLSYSWNYSGTGNSWSSSGPWAYAYYNSPGCGVNSSGVNFFWVYVTDGCGLTGLGSIGSLPCW